MKIDTSNIKMSSAHKLSRTATEKIEENVKFIDLYDQRLADFIGQPVVGQRSVQHSSPWYDSITVKGQKAVSFSRQFLGELEKLRQIMETICNRLNSTCMKGGQIQLSIFDRININSGMNPDMNFGGIMKEYEYSQTTTKSYQEKETEDFFADGMVNTEDGRSIDFSFQLNMAREFINIDQFVHKEKGYVMIDPLVVSQDGSIPKLSGASMSFDLNADGIQEDMLVPLTGTGFLSLDKNKDGIINDGSELFGPSSSDGFGELAEYDLDHNLWLDENDAIFDELTLWESDENGQMQLTRIKDAGIGAIYLVGIETPFDLKDGTNQLQARIKKSSVALNENGSVSAVQEMEWTA